MPAARSKHLEAISNTALAVLYARFVLGADLLHIHNIGPGLMGPLARMLGMKLVVTYHSKNFEHAKWNRFAKAVLRFGERCMVFTAHKVIDISRSTTEDLQRRYPKWDELTRDMLEVNQRLMQYRAVLREIALGPTEIREL